MTTASPARVPEGDGKTLRDFALKPPFAVAADRTVFVRVDPGHSTDHARETVRRHWANTAGSKA